MFGFSLLIEQCDISFEQAFPDVNERGTLGNVVKVKPHSPQTVNSRVVLTRGSNFNTIIRRVIFTPLMCRFEFDSRFDFDVGSK